MWCFTCVKTAGTTNHRMCLQGVSTPWEPMKRCFLMAAFCNRRGTKEDSVSAALSVWQPAMTEHWAVRNKLLSFTLLHWYRISLSTARPFLTQDKFNCFSFIMKMEEMLQFILVFSRTRGVNVNQLYVLKVYLPSSPKTSRGVLFILRRGNRLGGQVRGWETFGQTLMELWAACRDEQPEGRMWRLGLRSVRTDAGVTEIFSRMNGLTGTNLQYHLLEDLMVGHDWIRGESGIHVRTTTDWERDTNTWKQHLLWLCKRQDN